jgi:hypothetical protein
MIKMLLRVDPNKRPSCQQFLNCKLIKQKIKEIFGDNNLEKDDNNYNNVLLNSIKINNIREISKKLPKMKNYSNGDENEDNNNIINYVKDGEKGGSFQGENNNGNKANYNSKHGHNYNEVNNQNKKNNLKNKNNDNNFMRVDKKKRPQTGKNIRKN